MVTLQLWRLRICGISSDGVMARHNDQAMKTMHLMQLMRLVPVWQFPSFMLSRCNGKVLTALEATPSRQGCSGGTRSVLSEVQPSLRVASLATPQGLCYGRAT